MPNRIQLRRTKGWRKPEDAIVVARPTRWGNPFRVTECARVECGPTPGYCITLDRHALDHARTGYNLAHARAIAVDRYRAALPVTVDEIRAELAGRDLACWCPLDQPCHADVLLDLANSQDLS